MYSLSLTCALGAALLAWLELAAADEFSGVWSSLAGYVINVVDVKLDVGTSDALAIFTDGGGRDQETKGYIAWKSPWALVEYNVR